MPYKAMLWVALLCSFGLMIQVTKQDEEAVDFFRVKPKIQTYSISVGLETSEKISEDKHRMARSTKPCSTPKGLDHSQLYCKTFPSKIECMQTCVFGYTFQEGVQRKMKCFFDIGQWIPHKREEDCKPFVDCSVSLRPGGKMTCASHYLDKGPKCEISCQHYEDKDAVPKRVYECDIDGNWTPSLPHCATPKAGLSLVPAPTKKVPEKVVDF